MPAKTRKSKPTADAKPQDQPETKPKGLTIPRVFSQEDGPVYSQFEWNHRTAEIKDDKGRVIFQQHNCRAPKAWSDLALNVVASKYFFGEIGTEQRESSVADIVFRVVGAIADWGMRDGYFATSADHVRFCEELAYLCLGQYGSFNSPVWFNVGVPERGEPTGFRWCRETSQAVPVDSNSRWPQASACFIQSVDDTMSSIMDLAKSEAMLFKSGSGTGTDLSTIRSSREKLSGGGRPSGPLSFMRVYDSVAAIVKSGGRVRRAAKMQTLKVGHPDIREFAACKVAEERKAQALIAQGYEANFNGEAYSSVLFQNANLSVRATDEFLRAVEAAGDWTTRAVTTGEPMDTFPARELMDAIAEGTWLCGDPGMQFEDTIQRWHTCPNTAPINSSNPCSEYMFIDDSSCNLASLNLMKFRRDDGSFDVDRFRAACRIFIIAQDILVDRSSYPTARIAENSHKFRPLGLGYANLGALLMSKGLAYDSDEGRGLAAEITAIMHGQAYLASSELAKELGAFEGFVVNQDPMDEVIYRHGWESTKINSYRVRGSSVEDFDDCHANVYKHGFRNSQVTVLAPTGTIAFMMDCDTTGIEPDIALVKYKSLAGGGMLKIVNRTVPLGLRALGYAEPEVVAITAHIDAHDTIEGAPGLKPEHLPVFDCAFAPPQGGRSIHYRGHLQMMAAVQPFLSGAISKTVNLPNDATVADIRDTYLEAWRLGLKAVAIYRDGSKGSQPVSTKSEADQPTQAQPELAAATATPRRERLPDTRRSLTHKFDIQGHEGYMTVGFYPDGRPGEVFIQMAKEGSTVGGLMDAFATSLSIGLQYGVPLQVIVDKFAHSRFEPAGFTKHPDIPIAKSVTDYIARWLGIEFIPGYREANAPHRAIEVTPPAIELPAVAAIPDRSHSDTPPCPNCGGLTVRSGTCHRCTNCGDSLGCS